MADNYLRGHFIILKDGIWVYNDTKTPTAGNERKCNMCGREDSPEGHDGCLKEITGAMNACCGHGILSETYIQWNNGDCIQGVEAFNIISKQQER